MGILMEMQSGVFKKYNPLEIWENYTAEQVAKLSQCELELYYIAKAPDMNVVFLRDEYGNDWYQWLKTLSKKNLKVSYDPETKKIIHFSYDASSIFPINQIVVEVLPENVPDGFVDAGYNAFGGSFIFDKGKIITAPVDYELKAQRKKQELLAYANNIIEPLKDAIDLRMATEDEQNTLLAWRQYRVLLLRVDTSHTSNIIWPITPSS
ncbi:MULTISPECIES: tail fiber assembly protein [Enterobacter]|uniref:tail fiber assembly protein n=1 Tax=Enterobacter TaxID=547 RepID=UPI001867AC93|nr:MULTISPECIES: tail fiber assembly protein [Enterobacter]MBE3210831.1 tail fiber assembly protein [Enterobacter cloacae complex sp. P32C]MBY6297574.1 tail fiber assembly protein [Enterobacter bugandensis]MCM7429776.1 tail fiber assembly protein [Enterobacter bugandensis]MDZ5727754.1 tail fiber assembly protein [Enterobacter sp. D2]